MKNTGSQRKLIFALLLALSALLLWLPRAAAEDDIYASLRWNSNQTEPEYFVILFVEGPNGQPTQYEQVVGTGTLQLIESESYGPTCADDGLEAYEVVNVQIEPGFIYDSTNLRKSVTKLGHSLTQYEAQPATCTQDGTKEYYYCSVCRHYFSSNDPFSKNPINEAAIVDQAEGHSLTEYPYQAPTCTQKGHDSYYYCTKCHQNFLYNVPFSESPIDVPEINARGHSYVAPSSWSWTGYTAASATFVCVREGCTEAENEHTIQVQAQEISSTDVTPSCTNIVEKVYTATLHFVSETFYDRKTEEIQPIGHLYGDPQWTWTGYTAASATFTCTREGCTEAENEHSVEEEAEDITDNGAVASCAGPVEKIYTATVTFNSQTYQDQQTEVLQPIPHVYGEPEWTWTGYTAASAAFTCPNCPVGTEGHSVTVDATKIEDDGKQPAYLWTVTKTYTATVEFNGQTYYGYKKETLQPLSPGHEPKPSVTVTFLVVGGAWDDGSTAPITVSLPAGRQALKSSDIPAVGHKPAAHHEAGSWDTKPAAWALLTEDTVYTYTYAEKANQTVAVTFRVLNGEWDAGGSEDQYVSFTIYKDEEPPVLSAQDIPAVGNKPSGKYAVGNWTPVPSEGMQISEAMTFTYIYKAPASDESASAPPSAQTGNQGTANTGATRDSIIAKTKKALVKAMGNQFIKALGKALEIPTLDFGPTHTLNNLAEKTQYTKENMQRIKVNPDKTSSNSSSAQILSDQYWERIKKYTSSESAISTIQPESAIYTIQPDKDIASKIIEKNKQDIEKQVETSVKNGITIIKKSH